MSAVRRRVSHPLRVILVGMVVLACLVLTGSWALVHGAARDRVFTAHSAPNRDVALVLGAGLNADGSPSLYLAGRLRAAYDLYVSQKVKVILVSGDNRTVTYSEPGAMRSYLRLLGVPDRDVVADYAGLDTYDSCYRARNIFGVNSVTVVGQSYHLDRAVATCRSIGIDDTIGVSDEQSHDTSTWRTGEMREIPANVKFVWDRVTHRKPILGQRETSVTDALAEHDR
ncbi:MULTISPECIES: SanA/YdcF family protein [Propionibacterium]|uniref:SanA/YdcF family protein n=1 Tax=Propionibacterium TaxID=1743 RepID=UPI0005426A14|nr:ElyC/SanA/YdcF family protein [Propionibacterium freudenreichii]WGU89996.1 ElyC/SanA/YdcF family protein [Propionibacterium freudenreichii]CEG86575.1 Hypothetical secreted protein [Propionibacterium freudenreichii]CEG88529.1 Hypothetical secreted protein [Propionibacterium freudenreichii]CEG91097.1 Hypothetical secreted protein [Propionibacterium freudenreichii]CEG93315.1 Hypothetical secreted protein [Propionibacterium freudenreichii]